MSSIKKLIYSSLFSASCVFIYTQLSGFNVGFLSMLDSLNLVLIVFILTLIVLRFFGVLAIGTLSIIHALIVSFLIISVQYFDHFNGYIEYEALTLMGELINAAKNFVHPAWMMTSVVVLAILAFIFRNTYKHFITASVPSVVMIFLACGALIWVNNHHLKIQIRTLNPLAIKTIDESFYQKQNPLLYFLRSTPLFEPLEEQNKQDLQEYAMAAAILSGAVDTIPDEYHYSKYPNFILPYQGFVHKPSLLDPIRHIPESFDRNETNNLNVIFVVLESFRAWETELEFSGVQLTPNFNRIAEKAVHLTNAYSTSNYTVMSEQAIFCSVYDLNNPVPYGSLYGTINKKCLPKMLLEQGYETYWFHGNEKAFYNREIFHPSLGFNTLYDSEHFDGMDLDDSHYIGWGVNDETVFLNALKELQKSPQPFLAEILTLSNHLPFDWDFHDFKFPDELNELGKDKLASYHRSVYYADYALGKFFDAFMQSNLANNTILVVTGDHGAKVFPDEMSEIDKNDIFYRTPMLIYASHIKPQKIDIQLSHLDLAPTVLELLGVAPEQSFLGRPFIGDNAYTGDRPLLYTGTNEFGFKIGDTTCHTNLNYCDSGADNCYRDELVFCKDWNDDAAPWLEQLPYFVNFMSLGKRTGFYAGGN